MVNYKYLLILDCGIFVVMLYMLLKGLLSDFGIIEGYTESQIYTAVWATQILVVYLAWRVVLRPFLEEG